LPEGDRRRLYRSRFNVDFQVKTADGMGGHEDFANLRRKSAARMGDFMVTLNSEMSTISPDDYNHEYTLHDHRQPQDLHDQPAVQDR
jgi:hypothetical protein